MANRWNGEAQANGLVELACATFGPRKLLLDARQGMERLGVAAAVRDGRSEPVFDWLMEAVSFQGVSDAAAAKYMEEHGKPRYSDIDLGGGQRACSKLVSYWHYEGCGFHKGSGTCGEPERVQNCPVPRLDLRNGRLNQSAFALRLFFRDVAADDIVNWIDSRLKSAGQGVSDDRTRVRLMRQSLLEPLGHVYGLFSKVLSLALSTLLLGARPSRVTWVETGASMIAIDTLVLNWLHRTGILRDHDAEHDYGPRCYAAGGCSELIEHFASLVDARQYNSQYPGYFPRFVQKAIWRFCAQTGFDQCNGNHIDDRHACTRADCLFGPHCQRVPLRMVASESH